MEQRVYYGNVNPNGLADFLVMISSIPYSTSSQVSSQGILGALVRGIIERVYYLKS